MITTIYSNLNGGEIIAVVVAGTALYMLELPTVWSVAGCMFAGCFILQNCVRRLARRDALHTQMLDRRIQILERQVRADPDRVE